MGSRYIEAAMELEEEIIQIASTLARVDNSRLRPLWIKLIKEE